MRPELVKRCTPHSSLNNQALPLSSGRFLSQEDSESHPDPRPNLSDWDKPPRLNLLILQGTSFCNLNCNYCYLPNRQLKRRMSHHTVDAVFRDLEKAPFVGSEFTAAWHAGEPLTMGIPFYEYAIESSKILESRNCKVNHSVQTNATLIDDQWCKLFQNPRVQVGISLDGPAFLHDRVRRTRAGSGTHSRAMRGVKCLEHNAVDFHVICVLTRDSLNHPDEIFDFFSSMKLRRLCFNIDELEGVNMQSSMQAADSKAAYTQFLSRFYDLAKGTGMEVREFSSLKELIFSANYDRVSSQCLPFSIVSVDVDGNFSTFSPELLSMKHPRHNHFVFGNVHREPIASMLDSAHFRGIYREIAAGVERCRDSCGYFALCGGGAPSNKVFENGTFDSTETIFCQMAKQGVIDVVLRKVEAELEIGK